jgi:dihydroorotate dehydrogenase (fumarate)
MGTCTLVQAGWHNQHSEVVDPRGLRIVTAFIIPPDCCVLGCCWLLRAWLLRTTLLFGIFLAYDDFSEIYENNLLRVLVLCLSCSRHGSPASGTFTCRPAPHKTQECNGLRDNMGLPDIALLNSSNPWATTTEDLQRLFDCPGTDAVTTRTSLLHGFEHNNNIHQHTFFDPAHPYSKHQQHQDGRVPDTDGGSLNTLGYSPIILGTYLTMIAKVVQDSSLPDEIRTTKPWIVSVTGSAEAVRDCYQKIRTAQANISNQLCMEINLSCPNIPDKPPPAYSGASLAEYLDILLKERASTCDREVAIGIKTPPYTYHDQFRTLVDALLAASNPVCPIDFITATNTLGSSLVLADDDGSPAINSASGAGIGGMAGTPLHALALGNVKTIRTMLNQHEQLRDVRIIGVGGVSDAAGFRRMLAVGADSVAVGTALGRKGVGVFTEIKKGLS